MQHSEHYSLHHDQPDPISQPAGAGGLRRLSRRVIATALLASAVILPAQPTGGQVAAGQGLISQSGSTTSILQTSQNLSLNWATFNVASHETVNFVQPSATAIAVNRIFDPNGSQILGRLNANGQVFLINPNGILFGAGAQINVGGLVASTLDLDEASLPGSERFFRGPGPGRIVNQGTITAAPGGYVALLGHQVGNEGVITAQAGTVVLGAGSAATLTFSGQNLVQLQVGESVMDSLAENGGLIRADGGRIFMTAGARDTLLASVVNNTGVIEARTMENHGGIITLLGGQTAGTVRVSGAIEARGREAGQTGGTVQVLGATVGLFEHARLDVSGDAGGGTVLIGGDLQGTNPAVPHASATYLGADATINADATTRGNGGKVVLWADDTTRAHGGITARGGALGGNGGMIETSGHWLDVAGINVNAGAANGRRGTWLLDPADVTITGAATTGGAFGGGSPNVFTPGSTISSANVAVSTLVTALGTTDVTITTANTGTSGGGSGDITVSTPITWLATTTLTMIADRDIHVDQAITGTDGSLVANAANDIHVDAALTTTTGNLTMTAGHDVNMAAATTVTTGNITANAGHDVAVTALLKVTTGNIVLRADNDGNGPGVGGGTVAFTGSGSLIITSGLAIIRFNPAGYGNTGTEITNYGGMLTGGGTMDAKAWVFATAGAKIYDGTIGATAAFRGDPTVAGTKVVSLTGGTISFVDRNAGGAKAANFSGYSITGADAGLYDLFAGAGATTAVISQAPLTVTAQTDTKTYNGSAASAVAPLITTGALQTGDTTTTFAQTYDSPNAGTGKTLTAAGIVNDSNSGANYAYTFVTNTTGVINPKALTITGTLANNRAYDGSTLATLGNIGSVTTGVGAETLVLNSPLAANINFNTKDVVTANLVTGTGYTLANGGGGGLAGNYVLSSTTATAAANITPVSLTASVAAPDKVYNGNTTAAPTITVTSGLVNTETVTATGTATFNTKDVVTANLVTVTSTALADGTSGGLASNYSLGTGQTVAAFITPVSLTASVAAPDKVYNGNTTAAPTLTITSGLVNTETVTATGTATFNTKDVVTANLVTVTSTALADGTSGGLASNYSLGTGQTVAAFITPVSLTASVAAPDKVYNGNTTAAPTLTITSGLVNTETVTATGTATFNTKDVVTANLVTVTSTALADGTSGGLASNYSLGTGQTVAAFITPVSLTASVAAPDKVYNGNTTAAPTLTITSGLVNTETVTATGTATFNTKDVVTANLVTVTSTALADGTSGGLASNYSLGTGQTVAAFITPVSLTASVAAPDKVYNGNTTAAPTLTITSGLVNTETVTATGTATFNTKDVVTANLVTVTSTALADGTSGGLASNYSLGTGQTVAAFITPVSLTASVAAPDKVYNGNTTAAPTLTITSGLVNTETVTATGTATFNTKDVVTANLVTVTSTALADGTSGGLASNYSLGTGQTVAAFITPVSLTASVAAPDKVYNGNTTAAPTLTITSGLVNTETVTATGTATFNTKDVVTANLVTVTSTALADGTSGGLASNYSLGTGQTVAAFITPVSLTASVAAPDKVYNGNTTAAPTLTITSGLVNTETVTATGTATFNTKDVVTANLVTVTSTALADGTSGGLASNYSLGTGQTVAAFITPVSLTASVAVPDKVYNGNTTAAPTLTITSGLVNTESVTATGTATFNTKDVVTANLVTVTSTALADGTSGGLASNYSLGTGQTVAAFITPVSLTASVAAPDKVYNGNTTAAPTLTITSGLVNTETVTATGTATFNTKDVVTANLVTVTSTALADGTSGGLASNYSLGTGQTVAAFITPVSLTASVAAPDKVYNGNTTAAPTLTITSGLVNTETVTATGTATFNTKDVVTANLVTVTSTALADGTSGGLASNYSLGTGQTVAAFITPVSLTASVAAPDKVYNGNTTAAPTITITSGLVNTETVTATGTATFNTKDVVTANLVTVTSTALADGTSGGLASNYSLGTGQTVAAFITPVSLTASVAAPDKVYNGNTTAAPTLTITSGLVNTETVTATGTATFNTKDVVTANLVTVTSTALADGTSGGLASNYSLGTGQTVAAFITPVSLTASVAAPDKVYNGNTTAAPTLTITSGLVNTETVTATGTATFNTKDVVTANLVTVTSTALADGTSGGLASNYSLGTGQTVAAFITPVSLTASVAAPDKVYNGNTTAAPTLTITSGLVNTETVTATGTATFNTKDVVTANLVTVTSTALADGTSGGLASNYSLGTGQTVAAFITPVSLTASVAAPDKVYNGNTTAAPTLTITSGLVNTETVTATGTATFNTKDVVTANLVTVTSTALADGTSGGLASNYSLGTGQTVAAFITPVSLTASVAAPDKVYNGNTTAAPTLTITSGLVNTETVTATGTATFNTKDVVTANLVTVTSTALADGTSGGLASNYSLGTGQTVAAFITPVSLTASVAAPDKVYNGNTTAAPTLTITSGLVNTETVTATGTATFNTKDVVTANLVTVTSTALADGTSGGLASNYSLGTGQTVAAFITPVSLTASVAAPDKVYNGNTTAAPTLTITSGLVNTETVTATGTATFNTKDVVTANLVTVTSTALADGTSGGLASNYSLGTGQTVAAFITPVSLTASVAAPDKVYNGNTTAAPTLTITSGLVNTETVTATGTATFNTKDVVTANLVTVTSTALADGTSGGLASNYSLGTGQTVAAFITPVSLTASVAAPDKVYNGNTTAAPTLTITSGLVNTETVTATGTATFNTKDVVTANLVTVTSTALADGTSGGLASNYSLGTGQTVAAFITPVSLTASVAAPDKVYNGNTTAAPTLTITSGLVNTETVTATGTATFNTKDVVTANLVTVTSTALADGTSGGLASNYSLGTGQTVAAFITPLALTASVAAPSKVYDGDTSTTTTLTITSGLVNLETVIAMGTGSFNTKDVLTANLVTVDSATLADGLGGGLAGNYTLGTGQTVAANITPRSVSLTGTRGFDRTTDMAAGVLTVGVLVGSETLGLTGTGTVTDRNVGAPKPLGLGTLALGNGTGLASNYTFNGGAHAVGITPAGLTLGTSDVIKDYDGNLSALGTAVVASGTLFTGDTISAGTFAYTDPSVGAGNKTVTTAGVTVGDGNGGANYATSYANNTTSTINAASVTPLPVPTPVPTPDPLPITPLIPVPEPDPSPTPPLPEVIPPPPPAVAVAILSFPTSARRESLSLFPTITVTQGSESGLVVAGNAFSLRTGNGKAVNTTMGMGRIGPELYLVDDTQSARYKALTREESKPAARKTPVVGLLP